MDTHKILIPVDEILVLNEGQRETFSLQEHLVLDEEVLSADSDLSTKITFMKMKEGLLVTLSDLKTTVTTQCSRCLEDFQYRVHIPEAERIFYFRKEEAETGDPNDIYLIDTKNQEINIFEMIRQEILLHFPQTPVCSTGCEGICPNCGKVLNKGKCSCTNDTTKNDNQLNKPLSKLKDLFNQDNN